MQITNTAYLGGATGEVTEPRRLLTKPLIEIELEGVGEQGELGQVRGRDVANDAWTECTLCGYGVGSANFSPTRNALDKNRTLQRRGMKGVLLWTETL